MFILNLKDASRGIGQTGHWTVKLESYRKCVKFKAWIETAYGCIHSVSQALCLPCLKRKLQFTWKQCLSSFVKCIIKAQKWGDRGHFWMKNLGGKKDAMEFARIHANLIGSGLWTTFYPKQHTKQVYHNTITVLGFNITQHSSTTLGLKSFPNSSSTFLMSKSQMRSVFLFPLPCS